MCKSSVSDLPTQHKPHIGGEYEVAPEGGVFARHRLLTGVILRAGGAVAGHLVTDAAGCYVEAALDRDDQFVPASVNWDSAIVREVPPPTAPNGAVGVPAPAPIYYCAAQDAYLFPDEVAA